MVWPPELEVDGEDVPLADHAAVVTFRPSFDVETVADNARMERELEEVAHFKQQYEVYKAIQDVIHKHGIWVFRPSDAAAELDKALSKSVPDGIADIRQDMERIINRLKRMEEQAGSGGEETT